MAARWLALYKSVEHCAFQDIELHDQQADAETLRLILESIRDGADDSDEDEMQQAGLSLVLQRWMTWMCFIQRCAGCLVATRHNSCNLSMLTVMGSHAQAKEFAQAFAGEQGQQQVAASEDARAEAAATETPPGLPSAAAGGAGEAAQRGPAAVAAEASQHGVEPQQSSADAAQQTDSEAFEESEEQSSSPEELAAAVAASGPWSRIIRCVPMFMSLVMCIHPKHIE